MKNINLKIGLVLILVNSTIGMIFNSYETFNWLFVDFVIIFNITLLQIAYYSKISDGFKVALSFILPIIGVVTFLLSLELERKIENNIFLSGILILFSIQIIILMIAKTININK